MKTTTLTYPSADGVSTVRALMWEPDAGEGDGAAAVGAAAPAPRGLVQLVHGMSEHVERYEGFAEALTAAGFAVCANDHVGHGLTAGCDDDLGHMPLERGKDILLADVHALRTRALERLAGQAEARDAADADTGAGTGTGVGTGTPTRPEDIPYVIFGHSMGSFITRVYLTRHAFGVRAAVLCGTGQQPRALTAAGKVLTRALAAARGERYRSKLVDSMGAGGYARGIEDARTDVDWISTDDAVVDAYIQDPRCGQMFSVGGYHTLLSFVSDATSPKLAKRVPHGLPMLFIAGAEDPVGECGAGVHRAVEEYRRAGVERVDEIIYPGARHEILNEPCRDQVHADVLAWLDANV